MKKFEILDDYRIEGEPIDYKEAEKVWQIYCQLKGKNKDER